MGREHLGYPTIAEVKRMRVVEFFEAHAYLDEIERIQEKHRPKSLDE